MVWKFLVFDRAWLAANLGFFWWGVVDRALAVGFGIVALAANVPGANALLSGSVCTTDA